MTKLHIEGWVTRDDDGMVAVTENKGDYNWKAQALPILIKDYALKNGKVINNEYLGGTKTYEFDAKVNIYFSNEKLPLEEVHNDLLYDLTGGIEINIKLVKYSESGYDYVGYSLVKFTIGDYDLESEILKYEYKYLHFILEG